jgi:hypothetical protein
MPCYDSRTSPEETSRRQAELLKRNDYLINLLCQTGRAYAAGTEIPEEVLRFWAKHAAQDELNGEPWDTAHIKQIAENANC